MPTGPAGPPAGQRHAAGSSQRSAPLIRRSRPRHHPRRGALEQGQPLRPPAGSPARSGSPTRPVPIIATRLPGQVVVVVPAGGVEDLAGEGVEPRDVRDLRVGQRPGRGDDAHRRSGPRASSRSPSACSPSQRLIEHLGVRSGCGRGRSVRDMLQVRADLLPGEGARPVGVGRERERVQVRRHVAGAPGIAVVAPGAADRVGPLQDDEVGGPARSRTAAPRPPKPDPITATRTCAGQRSGLAGRRSRPDRDACYPDGLPATAGPPMLGLCTRGGRYPGFSIAVGQASSVGELRGEAWRSGGPAAGAGRQAGGMSRACRCCPGSARWRCAGWPASGGAW